MDPLLEPPDVFEVELPVVQVPAARWYRVHDRRLEALYFDREASFRFNAPARQFGVLYMSEKPEGAFAEALLSGRTRPPTLTEKQLQSRALTAFEWRTLTLADFTGFGLAALGLDARISSAASYELCRRWAAWVHAHPQSVDGLCYFARNAPSVRSVALFDRAGLPSEAALVEPTFLVEPGLLSPLGRQLVNAFKVAIVAL